MSYPPSPSPSWQPWQPPQGQGGGSMLAAHADRERAVDVLRAGFAEGRLPQPEFEKRVSRAYAARTIGELSLVVADLPQGPAPLTPVPVPPTFLSAPAMPPQQNGKAIASLVLGCATFFSAGLTGLPAVILGHMAHNEIRRTGQPGDGMAVAGLALGWLAVTGWTLFLLFLMFVV